MRYHVSTNTLPFETDTESFTVSLHPPPPPCEHASVLRPENPVIVGGLMAAEEGLAMVRARAKRHRWHGKTLKSNDPLVVSAGWRRFQTQPVFALEDPNERQR